MIQSRSADVAPHPVALVEAPAPPEPIRPRTIRHVGQWAAVPSRWRALLSIVGGITIWQLFVSFAHPSHLVMVGPWTVIQDARLLWQAGFLWADLRVSIEEFGVGIAIALVIGVSAGMLLGAGKGLAELFNPWLTIFYMVPVVAIAPLLIVALGIGMKAKIVIVVVSAFFPLAINTRAGVKAVDPGFHEVCQAFRASRVETFRYVLLPGSVPYILAGVRLALGRGLISLVFADLFGATAGIGYLILSSEQNLQTGNVYVAIVMLALLGLFFSWGVGVLERRFATYRSEPGGRSE